MTLIQLVVKKDSGRGQVVVDVELPTQFAAAVVDSLKHLIEVLHCAGPWED